jgi:hypothetical protein
LKSQITALTLPRLVRILLVLLAGWGLLSYILVAGVVLFGSSNLDQRAVILEAGGLILLWVVLGGWLAWRGHAPAAAWLKRLRLPWGLRFVLLWRGMAGIIG